MKKFAQINLEQFLKIIEKTYSVRKKKDDYILG